MTAGVRSFNFWVNQHLFLALARKDATPIRRAFEQLPPLPPWCQWNNFIRSHDVLSWHRCEVDEDGSYRVDLEPYGYRWLRSTARLGA